MFTSVASLVDPIHVRLIDAYGSGGCGWDHGFVWWARLEDREGNSTLICLDSRKASSTCHRLFEGAKHPSKPEAILIELGSVEEGVIISLLSNWLDLPEHKWLRDEAVEQMRLDLLHHGDEPHQFHSRVV